jgi:hypothetical protein
MYFEMPAPTHLARDQAFFHLDLFDVSRRDAGLLFDQTGTSLKNGVCSDAHIGLLGYQSDWRCSKNHQTRRR